jgi:hypothetical protein
VKENAANRPMHYDNVQMGIIHPPDKMPVVTVYSAREGRMRYNKMQHDLYEGQKKAKPPEKKSPKIIKVLLGIATLAGLFIYRKKIYNFFKEIFKKAETNSPQ